MPRRWSTSATIIATIRRTFAMTGTIAITTIMIGTTGMIATTPVIIATMPGITTGTGITTAANITADTATAATTELAEALLLAAPEFENDALQGCRLGFGSRQGLSDPQRHRGENAPAEGLLHRFALDAREVAAP